MGVLAERLEGNGVVYLARRLFAGIVQRYEVRWLEGLLGNGVRVVVLSTLSFERSY